MVCIISCSTWHQHTFTYHTHPFNGPLSGTTRVSRYQKGKTNLDFTEARDSEWQWNPLGRMQVCTSLQTDNHASTPPLSFLQARCPSCRPTNSVKALKAQLHLHTKTYKIKRRRNSIPFHFWHCTSIPLHSVHHWHNGRFRSHGAYLETADHHMYCVKNTA